MIKRPLDPRFSDPVREGRKYTTIRNKPWPVGKPVMLYNWSDKPYRSKQVDVAPVIVSGIWTIHITRNKDDSMRYESGMESDKPIHETEGFATAAEMDAWFRPLVKPGQTVEKALMRFSLLNAPDPRGGAQLGLSCAAHIHEAASARYADDPSEEHANELEATTRRLHRAARIFTDEEQMKRREESLPAVENAKKVLKRGDRVRCTKCPGTKRTFTFERWDGNWMVSKSGIDDFAPSCVDMVNGVAVDFIGQNAKTEGSARDAAPQP